MIGTTIKASRYNVTIKSQFGRWMVGHNRTAGWCVVDRTTSEIVTTHGDRKLAEKAATNRLIKDQDAARANQPAPASFSVESQDPRTGDWHEILRDSTLDHAADVAAQFIGAGYGARIN